jgi:hypothetical protein
MGSNESENHSKNLNNGAVQGDSHYVDIGDTRLFVEERGRGYSVLLLHGAPGASIIDSSETTSIRFAVNIV